MEIDKTTKLTQTEKSELKQQELIIDDGLKSFVSVGNALCVIKDKKLYREEFNSFDEYVKERWQIRKDYAYKLIAGSEIAQRVGGVTNECQARELNRVPYVDQQKVMDRAVENADLEDRVVTAKDIRLASSEPTSLTARTPNDDPWDSENLSEMWDMAFEVLGELKEVMRKLAAHPEGCWLQSHADTSEAKIRDLKNIVKHCMPAGGCPECHGGLKKFCDVCRSRGWLPATRLESVRKKLKE